MLLTLMFFVDIDGQNLNEIENFLPPKPSSMKGFWGEEIRHASNLTSLDAAVDPAAEGESDAVCTRA